jgi:hypothetical protein
MTTIAELFTDTVAAGRLAAEAAATEEILRSLPQRHRELRGVLDQLAQVTHVIDGVALAIDSFEEDQHHDVHVRTVGEPWPSRYANVARHVRTGQWMVLANGAGTPNGGVIFNAHHDSIADAVEVAARWVVTGER